jgi:hypothetical protein
MYAPGKIVERQVGGRKEKYTTTGRKGKHLLQEDQSATLSSALSQFGNINLCCHGGMQPFDQLDRAKSCASTP